MANYSRTTQEDLEFALGNLCDMMSAADIAEKIKGNAGLNKKGSGLNSKLF